MKLLEPNFLEYLSGREERGNCSSLGDRTLPPKMSAPDGDGSPITLHRSVGVLCKGLPSIGTVTPLSQAPQATENLEVSPYHSLSTARQPDSPSLFQVSPNPCKKFPSGK